MEVRVQYLINEKTVMLTGEYSNREEIWTRVIEGEETFLVKKAPTDVIEESLLHEGSNFIGTRLSLKYLYSPMRIRPISVNPQKGILLFPTKNVKRLSCIWFSLIHVKNTKPVGVRKTEVIMSFGQTILLDMSESSFITRWNKALELQARISKHLKCPIHFYVEPNQGFYISKSSNENNFTL